MGEHLFSVGFRPFFLGAAWFSVLWMAVWIRYLYGDLSLTPALPPMLWHGHEMIFGYTMAVIIGFVLTAVQNWTGLQPVSRKPLVGLTLLWLAARLGFSFPDWIPMVMTSVIDLALLPLIVLALGRVLILSGNRRNYVFIVFLGALWALNAGIHLDLHGVIPGSASTAMDLAVLLITLLLVFMGGRVIPFFTDNRLPAVTPRQWPWLNWVSTLSVAALLLFYLGVGRAPVLIPLLLAAAALILVRLLAWQPWFTLKEPLLWVLHLGYLWVPVGLVLLAAHLAGAAVPWSAGVHALMVGAMGTMTLGMMARVALGHSGRPLSVSAPMVLAFYCVTLAAVVRVASGFPNIPNWFLGAAGLLWCIAFLLYALVYTPILLKPRADAS